MKKFLSVTALFEGLTGIALLAFPSLVTSVLLGTSLTDSPGIMVARVGGSALISIAIACWYSRKGNSNSGLIKALLFYNVATALLLCYASVFENMSGIALWPAVAIHMALAAWGVGSKNHVAGQ